MASDDIYLVTSLPIILLQLRRRILRSVEVQSYEPRKLRWIWLSNSVSMLPPLQVINKWLPQATRSHTSPFTSTSVQELCYPLGNDAEGIEQINWVASTLYCVAQMKKFSCSKISQPASQTNARRSYKLLPTRVELVISGFHSPWLLILIYETGALTNWATEANIDLFMYYLCFTK